MVNKLAMFFAYLLFFILALMYFTPKTSLYYMLEKELKKHEVIISNEKVSDKGFSLDIKDATIYVKGIDSANVELTNVKLFTLYNTIKIKNIELSSVASTMIPLKIDALNLSYSIFNPLKVTAEGSGGFGEAKASFHILERALNLKVKPSNTMLKNYAKSMKKLKKNEDGSYSYDKTF